MNKLYIIILLLSTLTTGLFAQNFVVDKDTASGSFTADDDEHKVKILVNTELETLTLKWRVIEQEMPPEWNNSLCDNFQCYFDVKVGTQKVAQPIGSTSILPLEAGVNANNMGGEGKMVVKVFDENDSTQADTVVFQWNMTVGKEEISKTQFNIYPNPAKSTLNIVFNKALKKDVQVKIYNLVGQEQKNIKVFQLNNSISVDVRDLNNGTYLIQFINTDGKMTTQRFTKRM